MSSDTIASEMLGEYKGVIAIFYLVNDAVQWCSNKAAVALNKLFAEWKEICSKADENNLTPFIAQSDSLIRKCDVFCQQIVEQAGLTGDEINSRLANRFCLMHCQM